MQFVPIHIGQYHRERANPALINLVFYGRPTERQGFEIAFGENISANNTCMLTIQYDKVRTKIVIIHDYSLADGHIAYNAPPTLPGTPFFML
jgi:hypothetical protein